VLEYLPPPPVDGGGGGGVVGIVPPEPPPVAKVSLVKEPSSMLSASQETKAQEKAAIATAKSIFFILFRIKRCNMAVPIRNNFDFNKAKLVWTLVRFWEVQQTVRREVLYFPNNHHS